MSINIEKAVEHYKEFLGVVNERVEKMGPNGNIPTTVFAKEICGQMDTEWSVVYNMLKFFVLSTDDLTIAKGPKGGLKYIKKNVEEVVTETKIVE
jgi:hypothetical protein